MEEDEPGVTLRSQEVAVWFRSARICQQSQSGQNGAEALIAEIHFIEFGDIEPGRLGIQASVSEKIQIGDRSAKRLSGIFSIAIASAASVAPKPAA
jgi:hypothetical protein